MSVRHDETLSTCCLCTPYCAACRNFANLKFRPAEYNSICWHDTQNLVSANILLWSASLSFSPSFFLSFSLSLSLRWTVHCTLLYSVWTDSTTVRSVLQPNADSNSLSDQAKTFSVSFVMGPVQISTSAVNVLTALSAAFPQPFPYCLSTSRQTTSALF
jgi:hypothetical protein